MIETLNLECHTLDEILHLGYCGHIPAMTTEMWKILEDKVEVYGSNKYNEGWDSSFEEEEY